MVYDSPLGPYDPYAWLTCDLSGVPYTITSTLNEDVSFGVVHLLDGRCCCITLLNGRVTDRCPGNLNERSDSPVCVDCEADGHMP